MFSSRIGRSSLAVAIAMLIAIKLFSGSDDDSSTSASSSTASSTASTDNRSTGLTPSTLFSRIRNGTLPVFHPVEAGDLRLEGIARDGDHQPISGAKITLGRGAHPRTTTTEADGTFFFDALAAGDYDVLAESGELYAEDNDISLSDTSDPIELELHAGPTLDVLVVEKDGGAPIVGAKVQCCSDRYSFTGPDGHATLRAVDYQRALVTASAEGHAPHDLTVPTGDDPAIRLTRTIELVRGSRVEGIVVDEAGKPVEHALVEVDDDHQDRHDSVFSEPNGTWAFPDLATDNYLLHASSDLHIATPDLKIHHDSASVQRGVVVHVELGAQIRGSVVDAANHPVVEAKIQAGGQSAVSDEHGQFVLTGLAPDTYNVTAYTDTDGAPSQVITIARGDRKEMHFVVQPSNIAGTVVDSHGQPVEDARVTAESTDPNGRGYSKTDERGHFDLGGLPPGSYLLSASREDQTDRHDVPPARVQSGTRNVRLLLPELATLRGRVVLEGEPVAYYGYVLGDDPKVSRYETPVPVRDRDGTFHVGGLLGGTRTVVIVGPTFARKQIDNVQLVSGQITDLGDIVVEHGRLLHGHVTDEAGVPVAGAQVVLNGRFARDTDDVLDGRMGDRFGAQTDAEGAFTIAGLPAQGDDHVLIVASTAHARSHDQVVAADQEEIELVVGAVGTIAGTMDPATATHALVAVLPVDDDGTGTSVSINPDDKGVFASDPLPVGTYTVRLSGPWALPSRQIEVVADQTTTLHYDPIPATVTVLLHWPNCSFVYLEADDSDEHLAAGMCEGDAATLEQVVPGSYRVCDGDRCEAIEVPNTPSYSANLPPIPPDSDGEDPAPPDPD
jgi:protocatechuate 3,4-dioxygenase beta subunit